MTAPSPCDRLDAYLDGQLAPDEEAHFEAHLASCETCLEEPVLPADLRADLANVACPPHVVANALLQARRAPDRFPRTPPRRPLRSVGWVAVAVLTVGLTLWAWPTPAPTEASFAEQRTFSPDSPPVQEGTPEVPRLEGAPPSDPSGAQAGERGAAEASRRLQPPARPQRSPAPPAAEQDERTRTPEALVADTPAASPDSVAVAREEVLLALAIVADAQDRAAGAVAHGVGRVSDALHSTPHLLSPHSP